MEKENIYQFKVEDLSGRHRFLHIERESNDSEYYFKMWIDTTVQRSRSDL
jgi:hypothetical protein